MRPEQAFAAILIAWLSALALLIVYRVLTGKIALGGLLTMDGKRFSPERLQLLACTIAGLAAYASDALAEQKMPDLPSGALALFAASHAVYLGGKVAGR